MWGGRPRPPPLNLMFELILNSHKSDNLPDTLNQPEQARHTSEIPMPNQLQKRRTRVSAPHPTFSLTYPVLTP